MKKLKKSYVIPVCVIGMMLGISICLNTDCFGVIHRIVEKRYPQAGMDLTDWTGKEAILYDFKVNEDQSVTSTSNSGWLVFFFENYGLTVNNLRSIDLYVDHTDIAGTHFNVYTVEGYAWNFAMLKTGRIEIPLDSLKDSDMGIRLDMGLSEGINFKFDRIVFNDTEKICKDLINKGNGLLLCVAILGLLGAAVVLGRKYKKEIRISAKWLRFFYEKCIRGKELLIGAAFVLLTETLLVRWSEQNLLFLLPLTASAFLWEDMEV